MLPLKDIKAVIRKYFVFHFANFGSFFTKENVSLHLKPMLQHSIMAFSTPERHSY